MALKEGEDFKHKIARGCLGEKKGQRSSFFLILLLLSILIHTRELEEVVNVFIVLKQSWQKSGASKWFIKASRSLGKAGAVWKVDEEKKGQAGGSIAEELGSGSCVGPLPMLI